MSSIGILNSLLTRAHSIIAKFLTKEQLELLLSAKDLDQLKTAFLQTSYGAIIAPYDFENQLSEVARALKRSYANMILSFYRQSSMDIKNKIVQFTERYHIENIRIIIHGKFVERTKKEILDRIVELPRYSLNYYSTLIDKEIIEIINMQKGDFKEVLLEGYNEFKETGNFVALESVIDQHLYSSLLKISPQYKVYVNMKNIVALCRAIVLGIPPYRYLLPNKFISKALNEKSVRRVLEVYKYGPYKDVFSRFLQESGEIPIDQLEFAIEKYQTRMWIKLFRNRTLGSFDNLIGFFELKLAETMDLIRIIVGINAGLDKGSIKETLVFYNF